MSVYESAVSYIGAGISIIPIHCDGSKKAALSSWNPYRTNFASVHDLTVWFGGEHRGIAIVCGILSGGLEVLDFDHDADENFDAWRRSLPPEIHGKLCVVETGGGGYHVIYRCEQVCGNIKLAMSEDGKQTLIESRGEGGYIVAVGSPANVHKSGNPYAQVMGLTLPEVPRFALEERRIMWVQAAKLDLRPAGAVKAEYVKGRVKALTPVIDKNFDTSEPWNDFDARASWDDVLAPAGWTSSNGILWTRPGKDEPGASAKIVLSKKTGVPVLTVFSSSAGALSPAAGKSNQSWGKFAAFAALHHNGNRRTAAKAVITLGYGRASR